MMESNSFRVSAGLLFDFTKDKCLEQPAEQFPLAVEFGRAAAREIASKAGISKSAAWGS
jgi:hypothetical protein